MPVVSGGSLCTLMPGGACVAANLCRSCIELLRQYLYLLCTSKASKLSTCEQVELSGVAGALEKEAAEARDEMTRLQVLSLLALLVRRYKY